jgi:hypothetical protein
MRIALTTAAILAVMWMALPAARADDAAEIKKLIPESTALSSKEYEKFVGREPLKLSDLDEPSLTIMLLSTRPVKKEMKEQREQFGPTGDGQISMRKLREELFRPLRPGIEIDVPGNVPTGPVTMIHADRIRGITCEVKGDVARGTVSWEIPELLRGKFDYVAERKNGKWQITGLSMSAYKIHLVRNDEGKWTKK